MSIPHFSFPFRLADDGSIAVVEQDDPGEVEQGVRVLVQTEVGERLEVPEFGVADPTFQVNFNAEELARIASDWDDRAQVYIDQEAVGSEQTIRIYVEEK